MALLDISTQVSTFIGGDGNGLDHPECIAWGCDGYAYAGGEAGQIYRIDLEKRSFEEIANIGGGFVGGITGGTLFQWAPALAGAKGPLFYLTAAQLTFVATWLLSKRLAGYRQQTSVRCLLRRR